MTPVSIGQRRTKGTIRSTTTVQDDTGFPVETSADFGVEWVKIEPLDARESIAAQQVFGVTSAYLRMRFRDDVDETMHFVTDDGDVWDFLSPPIDPDGKRRELQILVGRSD